MIVYLKQLVSWLSAVPRWLWDSTAHLWKTSFWNKVMLLVIATQITVVSSAYGIALWYQYTTNDTISLGTTFIPAYASYLGVSPEETMDALINDVGVRQFRLVSYWNETEPSNNTLDFKQLDWQFQKAETVDARITLSLGLRQPRWPECHEPEWASTLPDDQYQRELNGFIEAVVLRYKDSPSLVSYQLENEALLEDFGTCENFSRERLVSEYNLVKRLDGNTPIILSRSNNTPSWQTGDPQPDIVGMSIYRKVWDGSFTKRYFTYPLPSWYYAFLAGGQKILKGQDTIIHELQAEPWPPDGKGMTQISIDEQSKTFGAGDLQSRVAFAEQTGIPYADLWGAEYWYYRKQVLGDSSTWMDAKQVFRQQR